MSDARRQWRQVSASQVTSFQTCQRLWFNRSILGKKTPPTAAQAKGTEIHAEQEHYLRTGDIRPTRYAALIRAMSGHLPDPGPRPDLLVEHEIGQAPGQPDAPRGKFQYGVDAIMGVRMIGYLDFAELGAIPEVGDAKSTKDFRYCKTPAELRKNVQLITYGAWIADLTGASRLELSHVYGLSEGKPAAHRVDAVVTAQEIKDRWQSDVLTSVASMKKIADAGVGLQDVRPTTSVCDNLFGKPCPYRADCGFEGGIDTMPGMTLAERLRAAKTAATTQDSAPSGASQATQQSEGASPGTAPAPSALGQASAAAPAATPSQAPAASASGQVQVKPTPLVAGVLPPDAASRVTTDEDVQVPAEAPAEKSKKRGRPKKTVSVTVEGQEVEALPEVQPEAQPADPELVKDVHNALARKAKESLPGFALFIDGGPSKGWAHPTEMGDWLAPIKVAICEQMKVGDYRFLDFGKARAALATGIRAQIEVNGLPAALRVDSGASGADVVIEELTPHAAFIFRGSR